MFVIGGGNLKTQLVRLIEQVQEGADSKLDKIRNYLDLSVEVDKLRELLGRMTIEKSQIEEKYSRREREIEHKLGLERQRQEQELALKIREGKLQVQEENLKADRKRFEDQMAFHEKRFTEEVGYLKGMIEPLLQALPKMTIKENIGSNRKR